MEFIDFNDSWSTIPPGLLQYAIGILIDAEKTAILIVIGGLNKYRLSELRAFRRMPLACETQLFR